METGQRAWSRITIEVDVAHDGDPELVAEHLALEVEHVIARAAGVDVMDGPNATAEVRSPGDELSARLPAWT